MVRLVAIGIVLAGMFGAGEPPTSALHSGASLVWTSTDPAVVKAREFLEAGALIQAEATVATSTVEDDRGRPARVEMREIIRRTRREFALTADELLAKFKTSIPDVTAADLERWRAEGHTVYRLLDGHLYYFIGEPADLQRGEVELDGRNLYFDDWTCEISFDLRVE